MLDAVTKQLLTGFIKEDFEGYDPFDGLNSRLFALSGLNLSRVARLAWLQFHKRSWINFRPMVGVPKTRNPKALALVILGLCAKYQSQPYEEGKRLALELGQWLLENACEKDQGRGYGYPFSWQARAFYVPKGTPNLIASVYVAKAFLALAQTFHLSHYVQAAHEIAEFLSAVLFDEQAGYFYYIPGQKVLVHNANLWGAATLASVMSSQDSAWLSQIKRAVATSVAAQHGDGAWVYGERHHHQFIDGFHTGYNLEALCLIQAKVDLSLAPVIDLGARYYFKQFFLADGTPKYYSDNIYPIDCHSVSQGILTALLLPGYQDQANQLVAYALKNLWNKQTQKFCYQRHKRVTNNICYMRWTQAWMFYALATYQANQQGLLCQQSSLAVASTV